MLYRHLSLIDFTAVALDDGLPPNWIRQDLLAIDGSKGRLVALTIARHPAKFWCEDLGLPFQEVEKEDCPLTIGDEHTSLVRVLWDADTRRYAVGRTKQVDLLVRTSDLPRFEFGAYCWGKTCWAPDGYMVCYMVPESAGDGLGMIPGVPRLVEVASIEEARQLLLEVRGRFDPAPFNAIETFSNLDGE